MTRIEDVFVLDEDDVYKMPLVQFVEKMQAILTAIPAEDRRFAVIDVGSVGGGAMLVVSDSRPKENDVTDRPNAADIQRAVDETSWRMYLNLSENPFDSEA